MSKKNLAYLILISTGFFIYILVDLYFKITIWSFIHENSIFEILYTSTSYIRNLTLPLFSFNLNMGFPILAHSEAGIFEPLNLLSSFLFDPLDQINFNYFSHLCLYSVSLFYLLNEVYKIRISISLLSSSLIVFSQLNISDAGHQYHIAIMSYLPITIILIEKYLLNNKFLIFFISFPLIISFQIFAGHFQYQLYCFILITSYLSLSLLLDMSQNDKLKKLIIFFLSFLLGFIISGPQLIPSFDLMLLGTRSNFDDTYLGSIGLSSLAVFYRPLAMSFNGITGNVTTLGYLIIFIFSFIKIFDFLSNRKYTINKILVKNIIIFFIMFLIGLGDNFFLNKFIYKIIPFLDSFRFPSRIMQINSFCTILIFSISLNELSKLNFKFKNINLIFIVISLLFLLFFWHFSKYIKLENQLNFGNIFDLIIIFYPFLIIFILFIILKYFRNIGLKFIFLFFLINIIENFVLMKKFHSHTFFINKDNIEYNQKVAKDFCEKHNKTSLNIVGHIEQRKYLEKTYPKKFEFDLPLTSYSCKVFYHHERDDVIKKGLGYNQSSLTTKKMTQLSEYQQNYQKKQNIDFYQNEEKYLSSLINYFVNSKVMYINKINNSIEDELYKLDSSYINNFIMNYSFTEKGNIIDKIRKYFQPSIIKILNNSNYSDFFPKISKNEITNISYNNFIFLPMWQSSDYYYRNNSKFYELKKFSFGHQISNDLSTFDIYYIPISFILGILSFSLGLFILLVIAAYFFIFKNFKN